MAKVSIVTPVYNGARHLAAAIESVQNQTFDDWDYLILDNGSTDATPDIIASYQNKDTRIRSQRNIEILPIIQNWNAAIRHISEDSKYAKVLHADDVLNPACLERMVDVADRYDTVGLVGSYVDSNGLTSTKGDIDKSREIFRGDEICRRTLHNEIYLFGSPSSLLVRSEIVRGRGRMFYNEEFYHADFEVCYDVLRRWDFGFVHEPLTFTRKHDQSQSSTKAARLNTSSVDEIGMLLKHGWLFLDPADYQKLYRQKMKLYRRLLSRRLVAGKGREYFEYHRNQLSHFGYRVGKTDLMLGIGTELAGWLTEPADSFERFRRQLFMKHRTGMIS